MIYHVNALHYLSYVAWDTQNLCNFALNPSNKKCFDQKIKHIPEHLRLKYDGSDLDVRRMWAQIRSNVWNSSGWTSSLFSTGTKKPSSADKRGFKLE